MVNVVQVILFLSCLSSFVVAKEANSTQQLPDGYIYSGQGDPITKRRPEPTTIEVLINKKYFEICEEELGQIPVEQVDCTLAQPIPMTRTMADGSVVSLNRHNIPASIPRFGSGSEQVSFNSSGFADVTTCDKPSAIFRDMKNVGCVPGDRIKYINNVLANGNKVDWVYICRKNNKIMDDPHLYNELGMIGYNRDTGKTCFFAGQPTLEAEVKGKWILTSVNEQTEESSTKIENIAAIPLVTGKEIPPPNFTDFDPESVKHWSLPVGGCVGCHSQGPFVRFPFTEPVACAVDPKTQSCSQHYNSIKECEVARENMPRRERLNTKCESVIPKRRPGMLYDPISPFDQKGELAAYINELAQSEGFDIGDKYYNNLMAAKWNHPMRLMDEEAKPCTVCHAIGNADYGDRFVHAGFVLGQLNPDDVKKYHIRSKLYLSNVSKSLRNEGFHDKKVLTDGLLPLRLGYDSVAERNAEREKQSIARYIKAIKHIKGCSAKDNNCSWDEHWTMTRVKEQPLKYLQDHCSFCHTSDMASPRLVTETDFKRLEIRERIINRLYETVNPMPPSGQFPDDVKAVLTEYLRAK